MPFNSNNETRRGVSVIVKELQGRCNEACNVIENAPLERPSENTKEKSTNYVRGLHTEIENSNTPIPTDFNLLTSQFASEMDAKTCQVKDLIAYTRGMICDADTEINRLNHQIKIAEDARSRPQTGTLEVQPEHVQTAKESFSMMKSELHGLIDSLFPDKVDFMKDFLGNLMAERLKDPNGYLPITEDKYGLIQLLLEMNIVNVNPYSKSEVKLAY